MPYQRGTAHRLAGTAVIAVSAPVGVSILLENIPNYAGWRTSEPRSYFDLGWCAWGNEDGFGPDVPLEHIRNWIFPLPEGVTLLGVTLTPPVTAVVTELWPVGRTNVGVMGQVGLGAFQFGTPRLA